MQNPFNLSLRALTGLTNSMFLSLSSEMQDKHLPWVFVKLNKQTRPQIPSLRTLSQSKHFHSISGDRWLARKYQSKAKPKPCRGKLNPVTPRPASLAHGHCDMTSYGLGTFCPKSHLYGSAGYSPLTADIPVHILDAFNMFLLYLKLHSHGFMYYDL